MSTREAFLQRVKSAVTEGNRAGAVPKLPEKSSVGYQGAGADSVARFCTELANAGGKGYIVNDAEAVIRTILGIVQPLGVRRMLLSSGGMVERLGLREKLMSAGLEVAATSPLSPGGRGAGGEGEARESFFSADVGITNVYRLIAETGTVVMSAMPSEPRSVSLLPPVYIAIADRTQLLPDLFDLFDLFAPTATPMRTLPPSCLTLITGPSKTGDIELRLVTGVHGPGEVHVILWNE